MSQAGTGNPAVVGLAGFGLTTLLLQLHNLGLVGMGPVVWSGFIFGGLAQMIAGLQEMKTGNNFGFCAFTAYGAFWISLSLMILGKSHGWFELGEQDMGWFLVAWTLFSGILWVGSLRIHGAMATTFSLLMVGFVLLDLEHFGFPMLKVPAALALIGCGLSAWYMMAATIFNQLWGRTVLPSGKAWVG
jgi:succinate-acetate transporter protein